MLLIVLCNIIFVLFSFCWILVMLFVLFVFWQLFRQFFNVGKEILLLFLVVWMVDSGILERNWFMSLERMLWVVMWGQFLVMMMLVMFLEWVQQWMIQFVMYFNCYQYIYMYILLVLILKRLKKKKIYFVFLYFVFVQVLFVLLLFC